MSFDSESFMNLNQKLVLNYVGGGGGDFRK